MKRIILPFILLFNFVPNLLFSQINWNLDNNSANFAFLVIDYNTYKFEGGYFTKFNYQPGFDVDSIPFGIIYNPPNDHRDILFSYSATNDTIFAADIWWAGQGHIIFPNKIDSASQFSYDSTTVSDPLSFSYYNYVSEIANSLFRPKADSAWLSIKELSALKKFSGQDSNYRVGLYLYAPAVGMFNPNVAKWIIFLYRGQIVVGIKDENIKPNNYQLYQNYPNPFNPTTVISYHLPTFSNVSLKIIDVLGNEVATLVNQEQPTGNYKISFDASNISSGVYFYTLRAGNFVQTKKLLLLR